MECVPENPMERGRKRQRKVPEPSEWKKEVAKRKQNLGEEYVSEKTGKVVKE